MISSLWNGSPDTAVISGAARPVEDLGLEGEGEARGGDAEGGFGERGVDLVLDE